VSGAWRRQAEGSRFFREQAAGRGLTEFRRRKGDLWTTPREAVWMGWLESDEHFGGRRGKASKEGRRTPVCVSEGGAKDRKVEKVPQGTGRSWTGKATRTWSYGSKVEVVCGKDQRPAPGSDDGSKSMLRQRWRASNLGVPANFKGGRRRSSDLRYGRRRAYTSVGIPKDSQCFLNPLSETAGGSFIGSRGGQSTLARLARSCPHALRVE
jgi:hypothetical protein